MIKMPLQRSNKLGKNGLIVFSDMGLFFNHNKIDELLKHDTKLFMSSFLINTKNENILLLQCKRFKSAYL
jgi:hypothetical protein